VILAKAVIIIAAMVGLAAASSWGYLIWSLDWGHPSYRGRALWLMLLAFPMAFIIPAVLFAVAFVLVLLWQVIFREEFPDLGKHPLPNRSVFGW
jgi:hypothetical protein